MISAEESRLVAIGYDGDIVPYLRGVATGDIPVQYPDFYPKDWRPRALPLMLWDAANEIERLRAES